MAFWNSAASEPKRQHRFLIYMNLGVDAAATHGTGAGGSATGFVPYLAKNISSSVIPTIIPEPLLGMSVSV